MSNAQYARHKEASGDKSEATFFMRKISLIIVILLIAESSFSQSNGKYRAEVDLTAGFSIMRFTHDSLVPPKRKGKLTIGDDMMVNAYLAFTLGKGHEIRTGLGYGERNFSLNKNTLGDIFIAIFSWGIHPYPDTFRLSQVRMRSDYLNIPFGYTKIFGKGANKKVQVRGGLQVNTSFLVNRRVRLVFDPSYTPSPAEQEQIRESYQNTMETFVLSFQPKMDVYFLLWKGAGIQLGLIPFMFYVNSWNKSLATNGTTISSTLGIHYNF